jgi:hypothetical protein
MVGMMVWLDKPRVKNYTPVQARNPKSEARNPKQIQSSKSA